MTPTEAAKLQGEMASDIKTASSGHIAIAILELQKELLERCDRYEKALRTVEAVTNPNGPDKASAQYMADSAHKIAREALGDE